MVTTESLTPLQRRAKHLAEVVGNVVMWDDVLAACASASAERLAAGGRLYAIGNGGSAGMAEHLVGELLGRLSADRERGPISAFSLCSDLAVLTAIGNVSGFEEVYARQLDRVALTGDVLVVFTTSGRSPNLIRAIETAGALGMYRIIFTGRADLVSMCDAVIVSPAPTSGTVQEVQLLMLHAFTESLEDALVLLESAGETDD